MTWLDNLVCSLVDQAAIQSVPVTCACGRTAESAQVALEKWWVDLATDWRCPECAYLRDPGCNEVEISEPSIKVITGAGLQLKLDRVTAHLERVLRILDTGEYRRAEDQAAIVAAREAVR